MNQFMAKNTVRFAGAATVKSVAASPIGFRNAGLAEQKPPVKTVPPPPVSLPLVSSQTGNLFVDRNDANLHWYLPDFTLAQDVDSGFSFVASQSGQDQNGNPFNTARLTLRVLKLQPDDVLKFSQANPAAKLQEVPLAEMSATLVSFYTDDAGQQQQRGFRATILDAGNRNFLLTFDGSILGSSVVGLYEDLTLFGKAVINLSASYEAWAQRGGLLIPIHFEQSAVLKTVAPEPPPTKAPMLGVKPQMLAVAPANRMRSFVPLMAQQHTGVSQQPSGDTLVQTRQSWTKPLPLGLKYKQDGYQLKFTVSTATIASHVIRDANDLKAFSLSQTEFTELKALGDVRQRYPTLSALYIGVLSRTIVVIPRSYSIVRGRLGCAALCMALVDSSATDGSKCKFEFDFTIAPAVSRIEFLKLTQEISSREDLKDFTPKLPEFQRDTPPSTLQTEFKSSVQFNAGVDPHTFAVTVSILDDGSQTPAVANANLFITRLCSNTGTDLVGSLSVKLDDGYPDSILPTIDLNFAHTVGTDEIVVELEEGSAQVKLTNDSPLDLKLSRYALIEGATLAEVDGLLSLPANSSLFVPLPEDHTDLMLAADSQLVIPNPMTKSDVARLLHFQTADVQETQYVVAVDGSGIDFNKVDSVVCTITFSNLSSVVPRSLKLNKNLRADSTHIVIPLENAVFSLLGTVSLAVHFVVTGPSDLNFTLENDFTSDPVLIILQSAIDKNLSKS